MDVNGVEIPDGIVDKPLDAQHDMLGGNTFVVDGDAVISELDALRRCQTRGDRGIDLEKAAAAISLHSCSEVKKSPNTSRE